MIVNGIFWEKWATAARAATQFVAGLGAAAMLLGNKKAGGISEYAPPARLFYLASSRVPQGQIDLVRPC